MVQQWSRSSQSHDARPPPGQLEDRSAEDDPFAPWLALVSAITERGSPASRAEPWSRCSGPRRTKLNPHSHAVFLDGHYAERRGELEFEALSHVSKSEVATVLEETRTKMFAYRRRRKMLAVDAGDNQMTPLAASEVRSHQP